MSLPVELVRRRTADGVLLHGALTGRGARHGVLLVHGAWGNFYATPVFELMPWAIEKGLAALSMNSRGHDLGTLGDGEPCIGFMRDLFEKAPLDLDTAAEVLIEAGVEQFVVVAHSYGAHKAAYWLAEDPPPEAVGFILASPAPHLRTTARWFVDGAVEHHLARAAAAVAAGAPEELIVMSSDAPVPMVGEAQSLLSTFGPGSLANSALHVPRISLPMLVTVGERESSGYRQRADEVAAAACDVELAVLDDDHYYSRDRAGFLDTISGWIDRRQLFDTMGENS